MYARVPFFNIVAGLQKRDSGTGVSLWILQKILSASFWKNTSAQLFERDQWKWDKLYQHKNGKLSWEFPDQLLFMLSLLNFFSLKKPVAKKSNCFNADTSSHQRCSLWKAVLRNFAKFTGKLMCQSLFFNKVAGLSLQLYQKRASGTGVFL